MSVQPILVHVGNMRVHGHRVRRRHGLHEVVHLHVVLVVCRRRRRHRVDLVGQVCRRLLEARKCRVLLLWRGLWRERLCGWNRNRSIHDISRRQRENATRPWRVGMFDLLVAVDDRLLLGAEPADVAGVATELVVRQHVLLLDVVQSEAPATHLAPVRLVGRSD